MRLAILGANGHIGKNLTERFSQRADCVLHLFVRDSARMRKFCDGLQAQAVTAIFNYTEFDRFTYDAVINCIGVADPGKRTEAGPEIFRITEEFDNFVLNYLSGHKDCRYINMSSGAVYGADFSIPADDQRKACYSLNPISTKDYYGIAKLHAEAKHRACTSHGIVDLRLFGFFSKHIDISCGFLLADAARCLLNSQRMETDTSDIIRDYVHPDDLFQLVRLCLEGEHRNQGLDVYSAASVAKFELLSMLKMEFGLEYDAIDQRNASEVDTKKQYHTLVRQASTIGYVPRYPALDAVRQEMTLLLRANRPAH